MFRTRRLSYFTLLACAAMLASAAGAQAALPGKTGDVAVNVNYSDRKGNVSSKITVFNKTGGQVREFDECTNHDPSVSGYGTTVGLKCRAPVGE